YGAEAAPVGDRLAVPLGEAVVGHFVPAVGEDGGGKLVVASLGLLDRKDVDVASVQPGPDPFGPGPSAVYIPCRDTHSQRLDHHDDGSGPALPPSQGSLHRAEQSSQGACSCCVQHVPHFGDIPVPREITHRAVTRFLATERATGAAPAAVHKRNSPSGTFVVPGNPSSTAPPCPSSPSRGAACLVAPVRPSSAPGLRDSQHTLLLAGFGRVVLDDRDPSEVCNGSKVFR